MASETHIFQDTDCYTTTKRIIKKRMTIRMIQ